MHIYSHPLCQQHLVPDGHPEHPKRLEAVLNHLRECGIAQDSPIREASFAGQEDIARAHSLTHIKFVQSILPSTDTPVPIDPDTWASAQSFAAASHAAGAVLDGVTDLLAGTTQRVFCAVRPPGHHAEQKSAMGFCLFNSIAIGALNALANPQIHKVAIVDFDVHHGNGTVDIFKDNPDVLVCSTFQHPHYPNRMFDVQRNNIINTPLNEGDGSTEFRRQIEADWLPALEQHKPDVIFVSAGFDAHRDDPLAQINLLAADYDWVTRLIVDCAIQFSQGRVLSTLEGGYNLEALCESVEAHLGALR